MNRMTQFALGGLILIAASGCRPSMTEPKANNTAIASITDVRTVGNFEGRFGDRYSDLTLGCMFFATIEERGFSFELTDQTILCWPNALKECAMLKSGDHIRVRVNGPNEYGWGSNCFTATATS